MAGVYEGENMGTFEIAIVIGVIGVGLVGMIGCRVLTQNQAEKCASDEVDAKDIDDANLPEVKQSSATYDNSEDPVSSSLLEKLREFPGSHRKVMTPPIFLRGTWVPYETRRGGWSQAKIIAVHGRFVLLNRQGTEFIRSVMFI